MAKFISKFDIVESICKKTPDDECRDGEDCVKCIIKFFGGEGRVENADD